MQRELNKELGITPELSLRDTLNILLKKVDSNHRVRDSRVTWNDVNEVLRTIGMTRYPEQGLPLTNTDLVDLMQTLSNKAFIELMSLEGRTDTESLQSYSEIKQIHEALLATTQFAFIGMTAATEILTEHRNSSGLQFGLPE